MQKIKNSKLIIIKLEDERGMVEIRRQVDSSDFSGVYQDMVENLGVEITKRIYKHYNGQQVTFPMRLYSNQLILKTIYLEVKNNEKTKFKKDNNNGIDSSKFDCSITNKSKC